jgi:tight adherence protein C
VPELQELAASVALAGAQGARIRQSLVAKADALRAAQAAELEAAAERRTERMLVPLMIMAFGLTLFVGYAAVQSITTNDSGRLNPVTTTTTTTFSP